MITTSAFRVAQSFIGVKLRQVSVCFPDWSSQRASGVPASAKSQRDRAGSHSDATTPASDGVSDTVMGQVNSSRRIRDLLAPGRPAAIVRFVMAVVVFSLNRVLRRWSQSHVLKKTLERFRPAIADRDASATVASVLARVWIQAPTFHCPPRSVFSRQRAAVAFRWRWPSLSIAPAGHLSAASQRCRANKTLVAAVAVTEPVVSVSVVPDSHQTTESLPSDVDQVASHLRHCIAT